jgi:hypothetical protein
MEPIKPWGDLPAIAEQEDVNRAPAHCLLTAETERDPCRVN